MTPVTLYALLAMQGVDLYAAPPKGYRKRPKVRKRNKIGAASRRRNR